MPNYTTSLADIYGLKNIDIRQLQNWARFMPEFSSLNMNIGLIPSYLQTPIGYSRQEVKTKKTPLSDLLNRYTQSKTYDIYRGGEVSRARSRDVDYNKIIEAIRRQRATRKPALRWNPTTGTYY